MKKFKLWVRMAGGGGGGGRRRRFPSHHPRTPSTVQAWLSVVLLATLIVLTSCHTSKSSRRSQVTIGQTRVGISSIDTLFWTSIYRNLSTIDIDIVRWSSPDSAGSQHVTEQVIMHRRDTIFQESEARRVTQEVDTTRITHQESVDESIRNTSGVLSSHMAGIKLIVLLCLASCGAGFYLGLRYHS